MNGSDRMTMIIAVTMALFLWAYMRLAQDTPEVTRIIQNVPVQVVGRMPSGYGARLHQDDQSIDVYIKGPAKRVNATTEEDIAVKLDVTGESRAKAVVQLRDISLPRGVRLARKPKVTLYTYSLTQQSFPVKVAFIAQPPPGTIVGEYSMHPATVTVEGRSETVQRVKYVTVRVDPNLPFTEREAIPRAIDADGERVDDVRVITPSVRVMMSSLTGKQTTRQIAVAQPELKNQPRGHLVRVAKIRPEVVTLSGESALLDRLEGFIATDAIDVSKVTRDTTVTVRLRVPRELTVVEGPTVRVDLEAQSVE